METILAEFVNILFYSLLVILACAMGISFLRDNQAFAIVRLVFSLFILFLCAIAGNKVSAVGITLLTVVIIVQLAALNGKKEYR